MKEMLGMLQTGADIATNAINRKHDKTMAELNYNYGERSADNAMKRQEDMYNKYQSPEAKLRQIKDAGLSVGMLYSQGGASGIGQMQTGPKGQGASGQAATAGRSPNVMGMLEARALESQVKVNDAQAKNIDADTEVKLGVDKDLKEANIQSVLQGIKNQEVINIGLNLDNRFKEVTADIAESTADDVITTVNYNMKKVEKELRLLLGKIEGQDMDNQIKLATMNDVIKQASLENDQILAEIYKTYRLTEAQINEINAHIGVLREKTKETEYNYDIAKQQIEIMKEGVKATLEGQERQLVGNILSAIATVTGAIIFAGSGMFKFLKGQPKKPNPTGFIK